MNRLPYDCCRFKGVDCAKKESCLRFVALGDMGPRTPISENMCAHENRMLSFIPVKVGK